MSSPRTARSLLTQLEQYYDAVPRRRARTERVGPFTLFVARSGWPYYARPLLGASEVICSSDIRRVLDRQRKLGVPRALEWVDEVTPGLAETAESMGVHVARCPLLVLAGQPPGSAESARILTADESNLLVSTRAAISVGFSHGGTGVSDVGHEAREAQLDSASKEVDESFVSSMRTGVLRIAAVFAPEARDESQQEPGDSGNCSPVGGGSYSPVDDVAELVGVAVLPAYRRRGLAAQVTHLLAMDAMARGVTTVFCSAQSEDVARVYEGIGFHRVGTACIAEAP